MIEIVTRQQSYDRSRDGDLYPDNGRSELYSKMMCLKHHQMFQYWTLGRKSSCSNGTGPKTVTLYPTVNDLPPPLVMINLDLHKITSVAVLGVGPFGRA